VVLASFTYSARDLSKIVSECFTKYFSTYKQGTNEDNVQHRDKSLTVLISQDVLLHRYCVLT